MKCSTRFLDDYSVRFRGEGLLKDRSVQNKTSLTSRQASMPHSQLNLLDRQEIAQVLHLFLEPFDPPLVVYKHELSDPLQPVLNTIEPHVNGIKSLLYVLLLCRFLKTPLHHTG